MQNVHPIFQTALRGIAPPADEKHWQAMCTQLRAELSLYDAPRPPRGQFAYTYRHPELGPLDCHMEGEGGDKEYGWPDIATLHEAYWRGGRFTDRLTSDEIEAIEISAAHQPTKQLEEV